MDEASTILVKAFQNERDIMYPGDLGRRNGITVIVTVALYLPLAPLFQHGQLPL